MDMFIKTAVTSHQTLIAATSINKDSAALVKVFVKRIQMNLSPEELQEQQQTKIEILIRTSLRDFITKEGKRIYRRVRRRKIPEEGERGKTSK